MSLLLDALKKAAEQKAGKNKTDSLEGESSDETLLDVATQDISSLERGDDSNVKFSPREGLDDTEFDGTEVDTRMQRARSETRVEIEETAFDPTQLEETEMVTRQMKSEAGSDDTQIQTGDKTITQPSSHSSQMQSGEDETIVFDEEDVSDFMGEPELVSRETRSAEDTELGDVDQTTSGDDTDIETSVNTQVEADEDPSLVDQDMSLLLVDRDDTDVSRTSATDPKLVPGAFRKTDDDPTDHNITVTGLGLVDVTEVGDQTVEEQTKTVEAEATSPTAVRTQTNESTVTLSDSTSTRTYAPDNYDRTLMKLPNEDASKLFAGMKSESDLVMTPDYAKKVFQSKSSAQRMQYYRLYTWIAVAILIALGIFGAVEYQDESDSIDTSLLPLKRDPMPGVIKSTSGQSNILFNENTATGVDTKTIELVESAESLGEEATAQAVVEGSMEVEQQVVVEEVSEQFQPTEVAKIDPEVESIEQETAPVVSSTSTLEITSSKRIEEKNIWLREAYTAYLAGDDQLALRKYNQVLEVDPINRNALLARAAINVHNNDTAAAIRDYKALLLANPKDSLAMTSLVSVGHYSPQETESQLKLMIRDEPESPYLNFALGNVYGAQNRWQEAQGVYFKALEYNPKDPNYAYNLAVSLEHISRPKVAIAYYQRALDNFEKGLATFSKDVVDQRLEMLRQL